MRTKERDLVPAAADDFEWKEAEIYRAEAVHSEKLG